MGWDKGTSGEFILFEVTGRDMASIITAGSERERVYTVSESGWKGLGSSCCSNVSCLRGLPCLGTSVYGLNYNVASTGGLDDWPNMTGQEEKYEQND